MASEDSTEETNKVFDHFSEKLLEIVNPPAPPPTDDKWPFRKLILPK